jgi:uncharacterized protein (TIGR03086 family)
METLEVVEQGLAWGRSRIAGIGDTPLDTPTPCARWDVRHLVNHVVSANAVIVKALSSEDGDWDAWGKDSVHADVLAEIDVWPNPLEQYDPNIAYVCAAARDFPPDRLFLMSGNQVPAIMLAHASSFDSVIHGWDLARVTGQDPEIPAGLVEAYLSIASGIPADGVATAFGPKIDVPASASPTDRLVAALGRQP